MKKVYLHIGYGKTGTSSLQTVLFKNKEALLRAGVLYPSIGLTGEAHHGLGIFQADHMSEALRGLYVALKNEIDKSPAKKVIISSEQFCFLRRAYLRSVKEFLTEYDVKIIFYVRNQRRLIESTFLQWQKEGREYGESINAFYQRNKAGFDFMRLIQPWIEEFGSENIVVRVYDRRIIGDDTCADFLQIVGLDENLVADEIRTNHSLIPEFSNLIRMIDQNDTALGYRSRIISELLDLSIQFQDASKKKLVDDGLAEEISQYYQSSNLALAQRFLNKEEAAIFTGQ